MVFQLDSNETSVDLYDTNFDEGPTLIWSNNNLGDGDHQLSAFVKGLPQNGSVAIDYFEYVVPLLTRTVFQQDVGFQV